jgi:hypothetical protein
MKLLLVIYRQSLEDDVRDLLRDLDVKAFTDDAEVPIRVFTSHVSS